MKTVRYLNSVLTVIAVLLTLNLYVQLTVGGPAVASTAHAADTAKKGVGSTAARQAEMVRSLDELVKVNTLINQTLTNATISVKVENLPAGQ